MTLDFAAYVHRQSPLHRWDPRHKLVGLGALIFAFALVEDWRLLPPMLGVTALLYGLTGLPLALLWHRLRYPGFLILGVVILLPLLSGTTVLWQWGPLVLKQEGTVAVVVIVGRFLAILTLGLILLATSPVLTTIKAMRSLGLPPILADMILLSYRYLHGVAGTLVTMQRAMRVRGFGHPRRSRWSFWPQTRDYRALAALAGTLLVRSYEQSERIYKAMCLRGYGQQPRSSHALFLPISGGDKGYPQRWSWVALTVMLCVATGFVALDLFWT